MVPQGNLTKKKPPDHPAAAVHFTGPGIQQTTKSTYRAISSLENPAAKECLSAARTYLGMVQQLSTNLASKVSGASATGLEMKTAIPAGPIPTSNAAAGRSGPSGPFRGFKQANRRKGRVKPNQIERTSTDFIPRLVSNGHD